MRRVPGGSVRVLVALAALAGALAIAAVAAAATQHTLTVSKAGLLATGTVTSQPAGIGCGSTCSHAYDEGTTVTLNATPASGAQFNGWSGACSGRTPCTVTMNSDRQVTANFAIRLGSPPKRTLAVQRAGTGSGTVTSSPSGINCGSTCSAQFDDGTFVTLTANAMPGSVFAGWSGAGCSGTGACQVTTNTDVTVTATFTALPRTITVQKNGSGSGTVTSAPSGINCGSTCSATFAFGTNVTLTATPAAGSVFAGWSGACSGTGPCQLTAGSDTTVTATFNKIPRTLTVQKAGNGTGAVTSSPAGISCGATCSHGFDTGTKVTLSATAAAGSTFAGWSGGSCSGVGTCAITLSADATVTATFKITQFTLTVHKAGTGDGTVTSSPTGINCGATCSHDFDQNTQVTLSASPAPETVFNGWSGAGCSGTGTCQVTMGSAQDVTATFAGPPPPPDTAIIAHGVRQRHRSATFQFVASGGVGKVGFQCKLDGHPWRGCASPWTYKNQPKGKHAFRVRAIDSRGKVDLTPATFIFKIRRK